MMIYSEKEEKVTGSMSMILSNSGQIQGISNKKFSDHQGPFSCSHCGKKIAKNGHFGAHIETRSSQKSHIPKQKSTLIILYSLYILCHIMYKCIAFHFNTQNFDIIFTFIASFPVSIHVYSYLHFKSIVPLSFKR